MNISFKVGAAGLLVGLGIFSIALHSNAACNLPNNTTVDIALESVQFSNDNVVSSDDDTPYSGTDWEASKKQPVSYKSGEKFKIEAKWTLSKSGLDVGNWRVRGESSGTDPNTIKIGHTVGGISVTEASQKITMEATEAETAFAASKVKYCPNFTIEWEFSFDGGSTWKKCSTGKSDNQLYVTSGEPTGTMFHTLLHIGCAEADGETDAIPIVGKIWSKFKSRNVQKVDLSTRGYGDAALTYYAIHPSPANVAELLSTGNGSCGAWAKFMRDVIELQGIKDARAVPILPVITSPAEKSRIIPKTMNGQGGALPAISIFPDHALVIYNNVIYDPSFGAISTNPTGLYYDLVYWQRDYLSSILYLDENDIIIGFSNNKTNWPLHVEEGSDY